MYKQEFIILVPNIMNSWYKYTYRICTNGDLVGKKVNMWLFFILQVTDHCCFVVQQNFISHCEKFAVAMQ